MRQSISKKTNIQYTIQEHTVSTSNKNSQPHKCENKAKKHKKDIRSSLDNCNNGKQSLNKNECVADYLYEKIGELYLDDFIEENDIDLKNEQYDNDTKVNFLMRGYIDLNKSDPCVKNLEKTFL